MLSCFHGFMSPTRPLLSAQGKRLGIWRFWRYCKLRQSMDMSESGHAISWEDCGKWNKMNDNYPGVSEPVGQKSSTTRWHFWLSEPQSPWNDVAVRELSRPKGAGFNGRNTNGTSKLSWKLKMDSWGSRVLHVLHLPCLATWVVKKSCPNFQIRVNVARTAEFELGATWKLKALQWLYRSIKSKEI